MGDDETTAGPAGPWRPQEQTPPRHQPWAVNSGPPSVGFDQPWARDATPVQHPAGPHPGQQPAVQHPGAQQPWAAQQRPWAAAPGAQQPWSPPPVAASTGRGTLVALVVSAVVVLVVGAGLAFVLWPDSPAPGSTTASSQEQAPGKVVPQGSGSGSGSDSDDESGSAPDAEGSSTPSRTTSAPATTTAPTAAELETAALAELADLRSQSLVGLSLDGRWVAQVASKSVGITDPLQTAANGTHTFYGVDILAENTSLRSLLAGTPVLMLQSTDFGRFSVDAAGQPYWVTIADAGFSGADDVAAWCASTFPELTAAELANACAARTLEPSHP